MSAWPAVPLNIWKLFVRHVIRPEYRDFALRPEEYAGAAGEVLVVALASGWALTYFFNHQVIEDNILKKIVGYNNLCVGWDEPPAVYFAAPLYLVIIYCYIRFMHLDTFRMKLTPAITSMQRRTVLISNSLTAIAFALSFQLMVIGPMQSAMGHSCAFIVLIIAFYFYYLSNFLEVDVKYHPQGVGVFIIFYGIAAFGFSFCALYQLFAFDRETSEPGRISPRLIQLLDYSWFLCIGLSSWFSPRAPSILHKSALAPGEEIRPLLSTTRCLRQNLCPKARDVHSPEDSADASDEVLLATMVASWLLTYAFNPGRIHDGEPTVDRGGYISFWAGWDSGPALYFGASVYPWIAFLQLEHMRLATFRMRLATSDKLFRRFCVFLANIFVAICYCTGVLMFIFRDGRPVYMHCGAIFLLAVSVWLAFLTSFATSDSVTHPAGSYVFLTIFGACTAGFVACGAIQTLAFDAELGRGPVDPLICKAFDYGWWWCVAAQRFLRPRGAPRIIFECELVEDDNFSFYVVGTPPTIHQPTAQDTEAKLRARACRALAAPLHLLLLPATLLGALASFAAAVARRTAACLCPCCLPSPNAGRTGPGQRPAPVPRASPFIGDALGYFAFLSRELAALRDASAKARSPVCTMNIGCPAVACLDQASTEAFMKGARVTEDTHPFLFEFHSDLFEGQKPNFCQKGEGALRVRRFLQSLTPVSEKDARFQEGLGAMEQMLQKWALVEVDGRAGDLVQMDLEKATLDVILAFTTTLFLGRTLDPDLLRPLGLDLQVPGATFTPHYPYIPRRLLPCYWGAKAVMKDVWKQIKAAPRGPDIMARAREVGLAEDEACAALLIAMTFNAFGLCNSLVNALLVLQALPRGGQEVLEDEPLLDSLAWELLRHNGPQVTTVAPRDVEIPAGREGPRHRVRRGTVLYSHLAYAQRDAAVYSDPDTFKPDRFSPLPPRCLRHRSDEGQEPLPTLGFGCPLGFIDDEEQRTSSHQCVFVHLAQPLVRHWVHTLARKFEWTVEETSLKRAASSPASAVPHFDYSISGLTGSGGTVSMVPKPVKRAGYRLVVFQLRDRQDAIVEAI
mmetsp:Transcript_97915/g.277131  ORF Transcript_97915/g.277131 Transcript_97915/m.277131 type:complete len:1076 (+) Transcript_97915:79-3306(+)